MPISEIGGRAARDVLLERSRQVAKGYDEEHDAQHSVADLIEMSTGYYNMRAKKREDRRVQLVKAVAVGLAAIERFDRS